VFETMFTYILIDFYKFNQIKWFLWLNLKGYEIFLYVHHYQQWKEGSKINGSDFAKKNSEFPFIKKIWKHLKNYPPDYQEHIPSSPQNKPYYLNYFHFWYPNIIIGNYMVQAHGTIIQEWAEHTK